MLLRPGAAAPPPVTLNQMRWAKAMAPERQRTFVETAPGTPPRTQSWRAAPMSARAEAVKALAQQLMKTGVDERRAYEEAEKLVDVGQTVGPIDPIGAADSALDAYRSWQAGKPLNAAGNLLWGVLGVVPGIGGKAKKGKEALEAGIDVAGDVTRAITPSPGAIPTPAGLPPPEDVQQAVAAARGAPAPGLAGPIPTGEEVGKIVTAVTTPKKGKGAKGTVTETLSPPLQGVVKSASETMRAGKGQRGMMAVPNLREVDLQRAIEIARDEPHLIQGADGQYVGGPRGFKTRKQIQQMRDSFDRQLERGLAGYPWYDIAREGNVMVAGPDPARQSLLARALALFSAQSNPDTNLGFMLTAHNAAELGEPVKIARTGQQARTYNTARQTGRPIALGKKTEPYGIHLDPTVPHGTTGVNDIWHARAFGFTGKGGKLFDKSLTAQEHQFLDYETILATERANARGLGGRTDWKAHEIQAAPWVAGKGEELARGWAVSDATKAAQDALKAAKTPDEKKAARAAKKAAARAQPTEAHLERGYMEAAKSYPEYFDKYTLNMTHEQTPGQSLPANFQNVRMTGTDADKQAYELASSWIDPVTGRDILVDAAGGYQRPALPGTGYWKTKTGDIQTNPAWSSQPLVALKAGEEGIADPSRKWAHGMQLYRGYADLQDASASHIVLPNIGSGKAGALSITMPGQMPSPTDPSLMMPIHNLGSRFGIPELSDTGKALTVADWLNPPPGVKLEEALSGRVLGRTGGRWMFQGPPTAGGDLPPNLSMQIGNLTGGGTTERVGTDSVYTPGYDILTPQDIEAGPANKVTEHLLGELGNYSQEFKDKIEKNPGFIAKLRANIARNEKYHRPSGENETAWFDAIQRALDILAKSGSAGLRAAIDKGIILPAAGAAVFAGWQTMPEEQQGAAPQAY